MKLELGLLCAGAVLGGTLVWTFLVSNPSPSPVDDIACGSMENLALHYHVHLQLWRDGKALVVPEGIGKAAPCYYWIHTHTSDGVVHIESSEDRPFTLGQIFAVWGRNPWGEGRADQTPGLKVWVKNEGDRAFHEVADWGNTLLTPHQIVAIGTGDFGPKAFTFPEDL